MNVVISGASRGIGLALVKAYLDVEAGVTALCRDPDGAKALSSIKTENRDLQILRADVTDAASVSEMHGLFGDRPVDLLLNVAGTIHMESAPEDINFDAWRQSFDVMAIGAFRMTLAFLPNLIAAKGKVASITSQIGASDWEVGGFYSYGSAKAALNRGMKSLATDLQSRGVAVAVIHPGYVRTDMGGPDGDLSPEESADGIKAVCAELTLETTGSFLNWNGGIHEW